MSLPELLSRLMSLLRKSRLDDELTDELEAHLEQAEKDLQDSGMTPEAARHAARRRFGGLEQIKEQYRDQRGLPVLELLGRDVRYSWRALLKSPGFTAIAVGSLALGIGANAAIFSIVDNLLLRPLPVDRPDQLVLVAPSEASGSFWDGRRDTRPPAWTNPLWEQIRERTDELFESAFAFRPARFNLASAGRTDFVDGVWASGAYFETLGVPPLVGRALTTDDDWRGGGADGPVAVISHAFWQHRFGGTGDVLGKTQTIERVPFTIVGVMPPGFFGAEVGRTFDIAIPLGTEPLIRGSSTALDSHRAHWLQVIARLKDGQSMDEAQEALRVAQPRICEAVLALGARPRDLQRHLAEPFALHPANGGTSSMRPAYAQPLMVMMVVVGLVLAISCANIANLLLARSAARRHEFSVRRALGASRGQLIRQLLVEALMLAAAGALAGLAVAHWGSRILVRQISTYRNTVFLDVGIDWRIIAFTMAVAVATVFLFALVPALRASRALPIEAIRERGRGAAADRRLVTGSMMVAGQVAFSLVLVVAAGLFVRTLKSLTEQDLGFEPEPVLLADLSLQSGSVDPSHRLALYDRLLGVVRASPGVAKAAVSSVTPISGMVLDASIEVDPGTADVASADAPRLVSYINTVSEDWFSTFGTRLIEGRDFDIRDRASSSPVAIVNEAFVEAFLPGASPIGRAVRLASPSPSEQASWMEVIGVAADSVYVSLRHAAPPTMYLPMRQQPGLDPVVTLSARTAEVSAAPLAGSVADAIEQTNHDISITLTSLKTQVDAALVRERVVAMLAGFFGSLALLLAVMGLYGVTSYAVSQRRAEMGVRKALGATPARLVRLVLARVGAIVLVGVAAGLVVSSWASTFVTPLLFGLEPGDPPTFAAAAAILATACLLAGWIPAHRASQVDPANVLREE